MQISRSQDIAAWRLGWPHKHNAKLLARHCSWCIMDQPNLWPGSGFLSNYDIHHTPLPLIQHMLTLGTMPLGARQHTRWQQACKRIEHAAPGWLGLAPDQHLGTTSAHHILTPYFASIPGRYVITPHCRRATWLSVNVMRHTSSR